MSLVFNGKQIIFFLEIFCSQENYIYLYYMLKDFRNIILLMPRVFLILPRRFSNNATCDVDFLNDQMMS